ncbi:MAG: hypothetical protein NZM44_00595, partial [Candidatus Calescibacterium sp.]|nr:hypothetical protein [Candidatus Calescibacterium sp.]
PKNVKEIFEQKGLTSSERKVLVDYKNALVEYIKETFGSSGKELDIVSSYNYDEQRIVASSIYQSSIRKVKVAINFAVGSSRYVLFSDFYIRNDMKKVQIKDYYENLELTIYGAFTTKTYISRVIRTKIQKGYDKGYPYSF